MTNYLLQTVWNPSEGIDLGFFIIRYYSLMFAVAFGLGWYITKHIFVRENESIEKLDKLFLYVVLATLFGARIGHVLFYQSELFKEDFLSVFLPIRTVPEFEFTGFSGLASHGAAIAIIITMIYFSKKIMQRPLLWILDRIVIPVASGAVFVRIGNLINSEIVGKETTSSLGFQFIQDRYSKPEIVEITGVKNYNDAYQEVTNNPEYQYLLKDVLVKHPAQLYEAVCYVFVFAILFFMYWKTDARNKLGLLFGTFLILLWSVRFVVEFVKESQGGFEKYPIFNTLSTGQWLSIPFIIIGIYFVVKSLKKQSL
jgi:phosphatidylglycerol:prolipoprotein diacylglycerol transferase